MDFIKIISVLHVGLLPKVLDHSLVENLKLKRNPKPKTLNRCNFGGRKNNYKDHGEDHGADSLKGTCVQCAAFLEGL